MRHPLLYEINTRVLLTERGRALGRPATLDDVTDAAIDDVAARGFTWVWLLGVWQTGEAGRAVSRTSTALRAHYGDSLPDWTDADVCGSPFAIRDYTVQDAFGGDAALARLRERLRARGIALMLDYVVNHSAPDHAWVERHPEYYVRGTEADLAKSPENYARFRVGRESLVLAYGRDPFFAGWPDTLQLNHRHPGLREAMIGELARIADRCDGVRCDMAMLVEPDVFHSTWGDAALPAAGTPPCDTPFWADAIPRVRRAHPRFVLAAEVYWDREWQLQQRGFDFTYDKRLYDRLRSGDAEAVRGHLRADPAFQERSLRFLENHDEPRAAATFAPDVHEACAVVAYFAPGMRFFHEGQLEGRRAFASVHLARRRPEPTDPRTAAFYERLLAALRRPEPHEGHRRAWNARSAWPGNETHAQLIVATWEGCAAAPDARLLVAVNFGPQRAQGYVTLDDAALRGKTFLLEDLLSDARYEREGDGLAGPGLYLDMPPWGRHVFALRPVQRA